MRSYLYQFIPLSREGFISGWVSVDSVFRRSFISALATISTLPVVPDRLGSAYPPAIPSEGSIMFWFHFYSAITRERSMSTERAREQTVDELDLTNLTDDEAVQFLKLASEGVYETADMPERWHGVFERMERDFRAP
jgi:hypothetical protein